MWRGEGKRYLKIATDVAETNNTAHAAATSVAALSLHFYHLRLSFEFTSTNKHFRMNLKP